VRRVPNAASALDVSTHQSRSTVFFFSFFFSFLSSPYLICIPAFKLNAGRYIHACNARRSSVCSTAERPDTHTQTRKPGEPRVGHIDGGVRYNIEIYLFRLYVLTQYNR
jgi:hypothetical protein